MNLDGRERKVAKSRLAKSRLGEIGVRVVNCTPAVRHDNQGQVGAASAALGCCAAAQRGSKLASNSAGGR